MIFLWILLSASRIPAEPGAARSVSLGMARFSYTLYLIHEPLLALLTRPLNPGSPWQPTPGHLLLAGAVLGIILLFAWGLAAVTEFHTAAVRGWVEGWLGRGETGAPDRHPLGWLA
jgi:peptidoglycan/LPS O-acetylase OafA/YrhL